MVNLPQHHCAPLIHVTSLLLLAATVLDHLSPTSKVLWQSHLWTLKASFSGINFLWSVSSATWTNEVSPRSSNFWHSLLHVAHTEQHIPKARNPKSQSYCVPLCRRRKGMVLLEASKINLSLPSFLSLRLTDISAAFTWLSLLCFISSTHLQKDTRDEI